MKTIVNTIDSKLEENVVFNIYKMSPFFESIISVLNNDKGNSFLIVYDAKEDLQKKINLYDIYYLEYINRTVFLYTAEKIYEIKESLSKLEKQLPNIFVRCSKSIIININEIKEFSSKLNGNIIAGLSNDEKVIISRRYVKDIKEALENS